MPRSWKTKLIPFQETFETFARGEGVTVLLAIRRNLGGHPIGMELTDLLRIGRAPDVGPVS